MQALNYIFDEIDGLCRNFDIKYEYEIYSGYFTNFTSGERLKVSFWI